MLIIITILILLIAIVILYSNCHQKHEGFNEYYYPYGEFLWNNPTRLYNYPYYYPYLYWYPYSYPYYYPYY